MLNDLGIFGVGKFLLVISDVYNWLCFIMLFDLYVRIFCNMFEVL